MENNSRPFPSGQVEVLDHGYIRLVDYMGSDLSIARNARVSYDAAWRAGEEPGSDARLIHYLLRNGHNTPFEAATVTFEVKAPIFVFRQWHRHRTQSYNELSARYKELPEEVYIPSPEIIGKQSEHNKQMRDIIADMTDEETRRREEEIQRVQEHAHASFELYHWLMGRGWPRELARGVLPLATYSHMFATANLFNWMRFMKERLHEHAQWEIREYAIAISGIMELLFPVAMTAFWDKYPKLSGQK